MNEALDVIQGLRSTHVILEKEIAESDLETILTSSVRAANGSARQSYSITVVEEKQVLKELFYGAKEALVYCVVRKLEATSAASPPIMNSALDR